MRYEIPICVRKWLTGVPPGPINPGRPGLPVGPWNPGGPKAPTAPGGPWKMKHFIIDNFHWSLNCVKESYEC